eukprot:GEMP01012100.1.p1 GENE.GEMP01012100.1~~GEMP01012100.1.p1  ORF type:complete len:437 (+),score=76.31 GEMP01012100.1:395-1705(+)
MRAALIVFVWLLLTFSFFGSKSETTKEDNASSASLYTGEITLSTIDSSSTAETIHESVPVRMHVVQKPSVLVGLAVATMSVQLTEEGGKKIGWYMEGVRAGSSSSWHGRTNSKLFPRFDRECGVILEVSRKAMHWSIMLNVCTILEIRAFISQAAVGHLLQVSVYTVGAISLIGIIEAALIVGLGMAYSLEFNTFSIVALFKFVTFTLLHVSYMGQLWKARLPRDADGNIDPAKITQLYVRFYMITLIVLLVVSRCSTYLPVIVVLGQCAFAPQIVYDVYHGHRNSLATSFLILITICKLLPSLYLYGCPYTIFTGDPMPQVPGNDGHGNAWVSFTLATCSLGFLGVSISQNVFGPRWFTPMKCLPHVYNYVRQVELKDGQLHECVICMSDIDTNVVLAEISVTPCDHLFHRQCLEQWLEIKMECPTCRADLPPLT